ncbi:uncharacterized protein LOC126720005 [Quercus robur]|uniref:uncharacterized protein LOC126720005 n=1 Tax=Quercus robur TaxID=38942 RepID=UPI002162F66D|nr:uncharacterized protein LOC126720005 [Quercus robur]
MAQPIISEPTLWKPPQSPFCKINFDDAVFQDQKMAGIGVVIRNPNGHVIGALSDRIFLPATVDEVEALACRKAISFALDLGVENVVLEGDSKTIIQALNSDSSCASSYGHIIDDIRVCALGFTSISFSHVKRQGNTIADSLAKLAKLSLCPSFWTDGLPRDIHSLVTADRCFC